MRFQIGTDEVLTARTLVDLVAILDDEPLYHSEHIVAVREVLATLLLSPNLWEFPDSEAAALRNMCIDIAARLREYQAPPGAI